MTHALKRVADLERFFGGRDRKRSTEELLTELIAGQQRIIELLERQHVSALSDDARFIAAIAASVKGCAFSLLELRAHARVDPDLQRAIGGLTNQQLGKRLKDLAGCVVGGFVVERIKRAEDGVIWAVSVAPDLHADSGANGDRGA